MGFIKKLPDVVANKIAAGEVVQRPASAVKELLENAIDAGADEITLIIKDAGKTLIQVIDNGCGMSEDDAMLAFERFATSKISTAEDLEDLHTLGFRGEALASIASIAQIELKRNAVKIRSPRLCALTAGSFKKLPKPMRPTALPSLCATFFTTFPHDASFSNPTRPNSSIFTTRF